MAGVGGAAEKTSVRMGFEYSRELITCGGQGLEDSGRMKVGSYQLWSSFRVTLRTLKDHDALGCFHEPLWHLE